MKLILAQGNPGPEYTASRHNVGFMVLDQIKNQYDATDFQSKNKFQAQISEFNYNNDKVILAKPTTFYNLTGQSARAIIDFYRISSEDTLVIHDELAIDFGTIRLRQQGSDAGNKGIKSLISHLGSDFWRMRIGIKNDLSEKVEAADFVLSRFSKDEVKRLESSILPAAAHVIEGFLRESLTPTTAVTL